MTDEPSPPPPRPEENDPGEETFDGEKTYVAGDDGSATRLDVQIRDEASGELSDVLPEQDAGDSAAGTSAVAEGSKTYGKPKRKKKSAETPEPDDLSGQTLDDFRVLRSLGQGGMARVYLAEQQSLRRQVALKVMAPELLAKPDAITRFRSEAMAAAGLSHGNIVQVYTVGEAGGKYYIAMEYVPGRNLRQLVRRSGPLPLGQALKVMSQAASALRAAGEAGIVHRDIKPANLMVSRRGVIKVADFGLSIAPNLDREGGELTKVGQTVGTPRYMSPEQVEGRPTDHRSDLYSLGVTFYYLLAGRAPYDGTTAVQIALQHLRSEPPSLLSVRPDLPPEVAGLVHNLMAKKPADRPDSAAEVVDRLRRLIRQYGGDGDETLHLTAEQTAAIRKQSSGTLRKKLLNLLGSQAAAVRSPKYLLLPLLACAAFGVLAGVAMRPADPLAVDATMAGVPKSASVEQQYLDAMFAGTPESFRAVDRYWAYDRTWTERARRQLLLQWVRDDRRRAEARELMDLMKKSTESDSQLVAQAAGVVLDAKSGSYSAARSKMRDLERSIGDLPRGWQDELRDAQRLIDRDGNRPRP